MAKAELDILLNKLSGRLTGDSKFYATHRNGRTVISNYPMHKDPKSITPAQKANSSVFAQLSKQAKQELANPEKHTYWKNMYDEYKRLANKNLKKANLHFFGTNPDGKLSVPADKYYKTLRGFIIAQLSKLNN